MKAAVIILFYLWMFFSIFQSTASIALEEEINCNSSLTTTSSSRSKRDGSPPCPSPEKIQPCTCDPYYNTLTCSDISSEATLQEVFKNYFGRRRLTKVEIKDSALASLNPGSFGNVRIHDIEISRNALTTVRSNAFAGSEFTALYINLNNNKLQDFAFESITSIVVLRQLQLAYNQLTEIPNRAFGNLTKLDFLALNNNQIKQIGEDAFANLFSLTFLDLSHNLLMKLGTASMAFSPKLTNQLSIILNDNNITVIEKNAFIGAKPTFLALIKNNLTSMDKETFQPLLQTMNGFGSVVGLAVQGNPINCDCHLLWLLEDHQLTRSLKPFQCKDGTVLSKLTKDFLICS